MHRYRDRSKVWPSVKWHYGVRALRSITFLWLRMLVTRVRALSCVTSGVCIFAQRARSAGHGVQTKNVLLDRSIMIDDFSRALK